MDRPRAEWAFSASASTCEELLQVLAQEVQAGPGGPPAAPDGADSSGDSDRAGEWTKLPELVGAKELEALLNVDKMTIHRWRQPRSGEGTNAFGPDRTYLIPEAGRIEAGPVWVKDDILRWWGDGRRKRRRPSSASKENVVVQHPRGREQ